MAAPGCGGETAGGRRSAWQRAGARAATTTPATTLVVVVLLDPYPQNVRVVGQLRLLLLLLCTGSHMLRKLLMAWWWCLLVLEGVEEAAASCRQRLRRGFPRKAQLSTSARLDSHAAGGRQLLRIEWRPWSAVAVRPGGVKVAHTANSEQ